MNEAQIKAQKVVEDIIKHCEDNMPEVESKEEYYVMLGNCICLEHVKRFKERKALERASF